MKMKAVYLDHFFCELVLMYFIRCCLFTFLLGCEREGKAIKLESAKSLSTLCRDSSLVSASVAVLDFTARLYI